MDTKKREALIAALQAECIEMDLQTKIKEQTTEEHITLAMFVDVSENMTMLTEVTIFNFDDEYSLLQVYSTMGRDIETEPMDQLTKAMEYINLSCPLGAFGVYREEKQLYHKHTTLLRNEWEQEECLSQIVKILELSFNVISEKEPVLVVLLMGSITCAEALEENIL